MCIHIYIYIYSLCIYVYLSIIPAIFCPFSQFCEIISYLLSLQKQPKTAPNLFQRGVDYGKYESTFRKGGCGGNRV